MADSTISPETFEREMKSLFATSEFLESDFDQMSDLLLHIGKQEWSYRPRTYAVLRMIDRVDLFDKIIIEGLKDIAFPYSANQLPQALSGHSVRFRFLEKQELVLTKAVDLEIEGGRHRHFAQDADLHFEKLGYLGHGGFGEVHRVRSKLSREEYARKRLNRKKTFSGDKDAIKAFEHELSHLKRLSHHHLVQFVGSYSDPKYIGLLISPVADYDLKKFLDRNPFPEKDLGLLRRFYGCLCSAVLYLHNNKTRHKDLKPENILIKNQTVLITDFGTARDWSNQSRSVTAGDPGVISKPYAAPEVILEGSRGSSADIWSLGCVYLDITTVLNGETLDDKFRFFDNRGTFTRIPAYNLQALDRWCSRPLPEGRDKQPIKWIQRMMHENRKTRPTAASLLDQILACQSPHIYCGSCCNENDESADDASYQGSIFDDKAIAQSRNMNVNTALLAASDGVIYDNPLSNSTSSLEAEIQGQHQIRTPTPDSEDEGFSIPPDGAGMNTAFLRAAEEGRGFVIQLLLAKGADIAAQDICGQTALHLAAENGHEDVARLLLEKGADIAAKDKCGSTALHSAAEGGHVAAAGLLLEEGVDIAAEDQFGWTALHLAAKGGHVAVAGLLLERGTDIAAKDDQGRTALHSAATYGHEAVADLLLEKRADIAAKDDEGWMALHWAAMNGHEAVAILLLEKGADITAKDDSRPTVLHVAATYGHEAMARLLLEKGADIAAKDEFGSTALHSAAEGGHVAAAGLLLEEGVDIAAEDQFGWTALHLAAKGGHVAVAGLLLERGTDIAAKDDQGRTALHSAATYGHEAVADLLLEKRADIAAKDDEGWMALHWAAMNGHKVVVRLLLEKGADIAAKDKDEQTALHVAAKNGHDAIARLLLEDGADIAVKDKNGWTALHLAAKHGRETEARLLLAKGADVAAKDKNRWTALHSAVEYGYEAMARLLLEKGADVAAETNRGWTALHLAAGNGHEALAILLLEEGANIAAQTTKGWTALHLAALNGHEAVVYKLLKKEADAEAETNEGWTALHLAVENGHEAIALLLLEERVNVTAKDDYGWTALHSAVLGIGQRLRRKTKAK